MGSMVESAKSTPSAYRFGQLAFVEGVALTTLSLVGAALFIAFATQATNCGGNSAALTACQNYIGVLEVWDRDHPNEAFRYRDAGRELQEEVTHLAGADWIRSARLLAKVENVRMDPHGVKEVVIACDRAYDNVPERRFWWSPMMHAVDYSTGEVGLISPSEFEQLDLTDCVDLQTMNLDGEAR